MSVVKIKDGDHQIAEGDREDLIAPVSQKDALYERVKKDLEGTKAYDEAIQYELARWIHLLETRDSDLKEMRGRSKPSEVIDQLVRKAEVAILSLLSDKPDLVFAQALRSQAELALLRRNGWLTRNLLAATGGSPVLTVFYGTLAALLSGILGVVATTVVPAKLSAATSMNLFGTIPHVDPHLSIVMLGGFLGGMLSVLARIHAFRRLGDFEHVFLFLNAGSRPFIGAVFGIFAHAVGQSGLLPLEVATTGGSAAHAFFAIAFIAGFSERFAKDLVSRGEGLVPAGKTG